MARSKPRNEVGLYDEFEGDGFSKAVLLKINRIPRDSSENSFEISLTFDGSRGLDAGLVARKSLKIRELHQRTLEPGGAHLEMVFTLDNCIIFIEDGREGAAQIGAIVHVHA